MRDSMRVRGPDDAGLHVADGIALAVRRLAILDLTPNGHMPMWDASGRFCIAHNGEVFNFRELRAELELLGVRFRSETDTEVIVELYAREGEAMLPRLNGIFAFAIWDALERELFIARDRLGVKPLCYAVHDSALWFASEPKALFAGGVPRTFDEQTWEELLCFRFTAGERTPFAGVSRLLAGHWLKWREGRLRVGRWWHLGAAACRPLERPWITNDWFARTFDDAVALRRISDVPVGILLSGGLDSASIAAAVALQTRESCATFTVGFGPEGYDERAGSREIAERWNLEYHDLVLAPAELPEHLRHVSRLRDEPLAHVNEAHLWRLAVLAKPIVTVLLSGEGADEILGGYVRYQPLRYLTELRELAGLVNFAARAVSGPSRLQKMSRFLALGATDDLVLFNACDVLPDDLRRVGMQPRDEFSARRDWLAEGREAYPSEPVRQAMYLDTHTFLTSLLDRNDRMTMGASIECREPFLDYRLVEGLAASRTEDLFGLARGKAILRRTMHDRLPARVLRHRKWGFGVPWNRYLRTAPELRQMVGMLPILEPIRSGPFDRNRLRAVVNGFLGGDDTDYALIFQMVMIAIWHEVCFSGS
jgi:asparagine synthase (glutamine-hydrolysing)